MLLQCKNVIGICKCLDEEVGWSGGKGLNPYVSRRFLPVSKQVLFLNKNLFPVGRLLPFSRLRKVVTP